MTRQEHLDWCKQRAIRYLDQGVNEGGAVTALVSFIADLGKHDETKNDPAIQTGTQLYLSGNLKTPEQVRKFIDEFN